MPVDLKQSLGWVCVCLCVCVCFGGGEVLVKLA